MPCYHLRPIGDATQYSDCGLFDSPPFEREGFEWIEGLPPDGATAYQAPLSAAAQLAASDIEMARITEDLIHTLITKGVIAASDLPQAAQIKLAGRKALRGKLDAVQG